MKKYLLPVVVVIFLLVNIFWVSQNNRLPFIGDDARWLQETNNLAVILKDGDLQGAWQKWQHMFITDTNSYPRTPLFTLLSVPTMLLFGPNEKAALITNLIVFAAVSLVVYQLCLEIFKQSKQKRIIALVAVILINLTPGYYGMARMYMSEILQTLFVLLITLLTLRWGNSGKLSNYAILGGLAALGLLLRFILPVYLVIPAIVFIYRQWKLKLKPTDYLARIGVFLLIFIPVAASWYGKNLFTYLEFTRFTSTGVLAEVSSLGPVLSPVTWARYWGVIGLWHFGWPLIAAAFAVIFIPAIRNIKKWRSLFVGKQNQLFLILMPIPALIATTMSLGKTARYFLPVEIFWLIFIAWAIVLSYYYWSDLLKKNAKWILYPSIALVSLFIALPFLQSVLVFLPRLPATGHLVSAASYLKTDNSVYAYNYLLKFYKENKSSYGESKFYLLPEQVRLNDAELIWFFTQHGENINTVGEFSPQITLEQGQEKVGQADLIIIDDNPDLAKAYYAKYNTLASQIKVNKFSIVASQDFVNGSKLLILKKVK